MSSSDFKVDFIGIGSGKCGSTWFYDNLVKHPLRVDLPRGNFEVSVPLRNQVKETIFTVKEGELGRMTLLYHRLDTSDTFFG